MAVTVKTHEHILVSSFYTQKPELHTPTQQTVFLFIYIGHCKMLINEKAVLTSIESLVAWYMNGERVNISSLLDNY